MQKYQWNFLGLSSEIKPTEGEYVTDGSTFYEVDTSTEYIYYKGTWYKQAGSGKVMEVVEITGMSGTLSDEDYNKLLGDNCLIKASTQYFIKEYQAATVIRYGAIPRKSNNSIIFDYIDIEKSTKAYELKYETYSN